MIKTPEMPYSAFPLVKLVYEYGDNKQTRNVRLSIRNSAHNECPHIFNMEINSGGCTGRIGNHEVPINTMGRYVFGVTGFRAAVFTMSFHDRLELYMYTDNVLALKMVDRGTRALGYRYRYGCRLDGRANAIVNKVTEALFSSVPGEEAILEEVY